MTACWLADDTQTERLGRALAASCPPRAVVHLQGDLGAGKSTLVRALLRALGVEGTIRSPTYTLVEPYQLAEGGRALHLDLYRIGGAGELEFLGLDDPAGVVLWLVEWPERGAGALPAPDLEVHLALSGTGRNVRLEPGTPAGQSWLAGANLNGQLRSFPESGPEEGAAGHGN